MGLRRHVRINTTGLLASTGFLLKYPWADRRLLPAPGGASHAPSNHPFLAANTYQMFWHSHPAQIFLSLTRLVGKILVVRRQCTFPPHNQKFAFLWLSVIAMVFLLQYPLLCLIKCFLPQFLSPILQQAFPPTSICPIQFDLLPDSAKNWHAWQPTWLLAISKKSLSCSLQWQYFHGNKPMRSLVYANIISMLHCCIYV